MSSVDDQVANQIANIERSTGRSMDEWAEIVNASGLEKHGQLVAMLKAQHGVGHGNANRIVTEALSRLAGERRRRTTSCRATTPARTRVSDPHTRR